MRDIKKADVGTIGERLTSILIILTIFVVLPSPAIHYMIHVDIKKVFVIAILSLIWFLIIKNVRTKISSGIIFLFFILIFLTLWASLFSNSTSQLLLGAVLLLMISISKPVVRLAFTPYSINFAFYFTVVLLAGAWIGLFYSLMGGVPQLCFDNPNGRPNCLYLTTFSNSDNVEFWGLIRPAGVFDEPGALSFFTILIVCLNELFDGGKTKSLVLLFMGLVTFSLAHILCFAAYCAFIFRKRFIYIVLAGTIMVGFGVNYAAKDSLLYLNLFSRFAFSKDEGLKGDNRSVQVKEFFSLLNSDISRYGDNVMVKQSGGESEAIDQSSNPFSIWFGYGLLMWIPYAITLVVLFYHVLDRNQAVQITSISLTLLLLQRPYIYSMYWGFAIWSVVLVMFLKKSEFSKKTHSVHNAKTMNMITDAPTA